MEEFWIEVSIDAPGFKPGDYCILPRSLSQKLNECSGGRDKAIYQKESSLRGFLGGSVVKNPLANAGDAGSISGSGRFPWRRKWQPILVFLPGKSHGQRSLVGYSPWSHKVLVANEHEHKRGSSRTSFAT